MKKTVFWIVGPALWIAGLLACMWWVNTLRLEPAWCVAVGMMYGCVVTPLLSLVYGRWVSE